MVVAGGQNINLDHVILQFILRLCVNNLGSSERPVLFVLCLKAKIITKGRKLFRSFNNSEYGAMHTLTPAWISLRDDSGCQKFCGENGTKMKSNFYNRNPTGTNTSRICQVHFLLFLFSPLLLFLFSSEATTKRSTALMISFSKLMLYDINLGLTNTKQTNGLSRSNWRNWLLCPCLSPVKEFKD